MPSYDYDYTRTQRKKKKFFFVLVRREATRKTTSLDGNTLSIEAIKIFSFREANFTFFLNRESSRDRLKMEFHIK
jgi:hypothetical protein